jgi:hypothetical protein
MVGEHRLPGVLIGGTPFAFRALDQKEAEMLYVLAEGRPSTASTVLTSGRSYRREVIGRASGASALNQGSGKTTNKDSPEGGEYDGP